MHRTTFIDINLEPLAKDGRHCLFSQFFRNMIPENIGLEILVY